MYPTKPSELLRSALSLLPPLPCSVNVLSQEGGSFSPTLAAVEGDLVYAYGARALVKDDLILEARLRDDRDEGWDIHFSILRTYFQSGDDLLLHLNVVPVKPRSATRLAARAHLAELATARVVYAHSYERGELFDVRLADASPTGAAFVTERRLASRRPARAGDVHRGPGGAGGGARRARRPRGLRPQPRRQRDHDHPRGRAGTCCCAWPSATSGTTRPSSATPTWPCCAPPPAASSR